MHLKLTAVGSIFSATPSKVKGDMNAGGPPVSQKAQELWTEIQQTNESLNNQMEGLDKNLSKVL